MLLDLGAAINHQTKASSLFLYLHLYYNIKCYAILIYIYIYIICRQTSELREFSYVPVCLWYRADIPL